MTPALGGTLTGIGGLLVGLTAVGSLIIAFRARRDAAEARRVSPTAVLEGLRTQVQAVVDAHEESFRRHAAERDDLERSLRQERNRADGCEVITLRLQAQLTEMRIDFAASRSEVADLKSRFEASIASHP